MSIVSPWLSGARVLDLFAGSGALGLEALSRGATSAEFVEQAGESLKALRDNIRSLGAGAVVSVCREDAIKYLTRIDHVAFDVAFADPPYDQGLAAAVAARWLESPFAAILGVEHSTRETMPPGGESRVYGSTALTLYKLDSGL